MPRLLCFLFALIHLVACAPALQKQHSTLATQPVCCEAIENLDFRSVPIGKAVEFKIDETSPAFEFEEGKSYFVALEIPEYTSRIVFKSYFNGMFVGQYFQPIALFLDDGFSQVGKVVVPMRFTRPGFSDDDHMVGWVSWNPEDSPSYLVLFTQEFTNEAPVAHLPPSATAFTMGEVFVPVKTAGSAKELERSPTGTLKVVFWP